MNQVYCGCGVYHVYIAILKAYEDKRDGRKSILIVINDRTANIETLLPNLRALGVFEAVVSVASYSIFKGLKKKIGLKQYIFNRAASIVTAFEKKNPHILAYDDFIKKAEINLFHIVRTRAYFLIKYPKNTFRMMEEGTGTYVETMPFSRYIKRKYFMNYPLLMGYDKQVKEVVVQFPNQMKSKTLRTKAVALPLNDLENALTSVECKNLVSCFQGNTINLYTENKKAIILTQPLIAAGFQVSQDKMIAIYKDFVAEAKAAGVSEVYIKEHPREDLDYSKFISDVLFIPKLMPIEILNLDSKILFDYAYTICSGSIDNLINVKNKVSLGRDYLRK
jgi:hypothetical protein